MRVMETPNRYVEQGGWEAAVLIKPISDRKKGETPIVSVGEMSCPEPLLKGKCKVYS